MSNAIEKAVSEAEVPRHQAHSHPSIHSPFKRFLDIILAIVGGMFAAPIMLLTALLLKVFDRGTVIFAHSRIGLNGERFRCYKFRTMVMDADVQLKRILEEDPKARHEWAETQKLHNDPRITRIGKFLRVTSLDELPQLWNVLMGDMSIVGPRPIVENEIAKYGRNYPTYSAVRPGLTGPWQVNGRSNTSYEERVQLDVDYAEQWSLYGDVKLIIMTIPALLFTRGAV